MNGTLTDKDIAQLPLSDHAKITHKGQKYTAEIIQEMLNRGVCTPKVIYVGCSQGRILVGCRGYAGNPLWGVLVVGLHGWRPVIVTGFAVEACRLDALAVRNGCKLPGIYAP